MLLDDEIGYDEQNGKGISGAKFSRELMFLDTLNKSKINIWIHSLGGSVHDAEQIVATILKTKTRVDTHIIGIAASAAGPIFLAGRNRYIVEHGKLMMHPVSGALDQKSYEAYTNTVVKMLSSRTDLSESTIRTMMNETTWLDAEKCEKLGLCTMERNNQFNKPRRAFDPANIHDSYQDLKAIVNSAIEKHKPIIMRKVTNKLKLNESANEDAILESIERIENRAVQAEGKLVSQEAENKAKVEALNKQIADLNEAKNKAEKELADIRNKAEAEAKAEKEKKVKETVTNLVKAGKIKNDAKIIEAAEKAAAADLEAFNTLYEAMPVSIKGPGNILNKEEYQVKYSAAGVMANIALKNKQTRI